MVRIIYGTNRSDKTELIYSKIAEDLKNNEKVFLIVPEQTVLEAERALCEKDIFSLNCQVVSFRRLCNLIFRKYGGLCYNYISKAGKQVVMWRTVKELSPMLKKYAQAADKESALLPVLVSTVEEFLMHGITPDMLNEVSSRVDDDEELVKTLESLSQIYALYSHILHEKYDDPSDDITAAYEKLLKSDFFNECTVYVDGFSGFTAQEISLLGRIIAQSKEVTLTLGYEKRDRREHFERLRKTDRAVRRQADYAGKKVYDISFESERESKEIEYIAKKLWSFDSIAYKNDIDDVKIIKCRDKQAEAMAVALDIKKRIMSGALYKDFTVIVRNLSDYRGLVQSAFEKCEIPCFMSYRTDVKSKSQIRLLLSALAIKVYNWQSDNVLTYIKSGLCLLSDEESDVLCEYIRMWKINGKRWTDENEWRMNPEGFGAEYTEEVQKKLVELNRLRKIVSEPLVQLFEAFGSNSTVKQASVALVRYMSCLGLGEKISEGAQRKRSEGKNSEADEDMQLWNCIISTLDTLVTVAGDVKISVQEYMELLSLMLDNTDIGKIPPGIDEVTVANADMFRSTGRKYVYVMGVNEKVFPKSVNLSGLLKEKEREKLEELGLSIFQSSDETMYDELLHFYNALTCATEKISVLYNDGTRPSVGIYGLSNLFEKLIEQDFSKISDNDKICSTITAFEYAAANKKSALADDIITHISKKDAKYALAAKALDMPLVEGKCVVSTAVTDTLCENGIMLSQSKVDKYVSCPFAFFCRYVVKLNPQGSGDVESRDIGNYVHKVLELFFKEVSGRDMSLLEEKEIEQITERIIEKYKNELVQGETDKRTECLFERLASLSKLMIKNLVMEFSQSRFQPSLFEFPIDAFGGIPSLPMVLDDGTRVHMKGYIDRVDTYCEGDDVYVRVVDYKTGSKTFSMADIEKGLNLQMLIYLFTLCSSSDERFRNSIGVKKNGRILPAGVLYFLAGAPDITSESGDVANTEEAISKVMDGIVRRGLLIDDVNVLMAMEKDLAGKYIPVKLKKDGTFYANSAVENTEGFERLKKNVVKKIEEVAEGIRNGRADASPLIDNANNACLYCDMKSICRRRSEGADGNGED